MDWSEFLINKDLTIREALKQLDKTAKKSLFVVTKNKKLLGALSDGDIRRWILKTGSISGKVKDVYNCNPVYLKFDSKDKEIKEVMRRSSIEAIPLINDSKEIEKIYFWEDLFKEKTHKFSQINLPVIIMAGGKGTRLDPFTRILPKPLIPIGDKPIIEVIMDEYAKFGMKIFYISINRKGRMVKAYFEDHKSDYSFQYINEDKPLGTAGALKYLEGKFDTPFFVSNCDIIIKDDYTNIYDFHKKDDYTLTLVASMQNHIIPYGICEIENGGELKKIIEKPQYNFLVNTGMYLLNPEVLKFIPGNSFFHITQLIEKLQKAGYKIGVYPVSEKSWIDVGQWEEYNKFIKSY